MSDVDTILSAKGLRMAFAGVEVLSGVDLDLRAGEVHALVGENGAGKSTLAKIVAGVHQATAGSLEMGGARLDLSGPREALAKGIDLIHQEPQTFPDLTVAENIFVGHQLVRALGYVDWRAMNTEADRLLRLLGARFTSRRLAGGLSVADQQTIELAYALSHDVKVLLMDETTAALTPKEVEELFAIVRRLRDEGCAIVLVTHRLEEVFALSDRITVLRDGSKVGELTTAQSSVEEVVRLMVGRDLETPPARREAGQESGAPDFGGSATRTAQARLRVRGLSRTGEFDAIDLEVASGEIVVLAGLVGAGRTEVCETIFGVRRPSAGTVEIDGSVVQVRHPREAIRLGMAMAPEDRQHNGLLLPQSIVHNASLAGLQQLTGRLWVRERIEKAASLEVLRQLQTTYRTGDQPVRELSGGNQQKVVLAKWLLTKPMVLILDEPTRGVDVGAKAEVHRLMRELASQGLAILMVSSDLPEVLSMADRILVMREGRLVAEFSHEEASAEKVMFAATGQVADAA